MLALCLAITSLWLAGTMPDQASAETPPTADGNEQSMTADSLPTVQLDDGVAWATAVSGNIAYVGGNFSNVRPAGSAKGQDLTARGNLLAFDITTGQLITQFAPNLNAQVNALAISPDGSRLYVGGKFTKADGVTRYRIAAYDTATGILESSFQPVVDASVNAMVATDTTLYVGGIFRYSNGNARDRLAAFSVSTGALVAWAPSADYTVNSMVLSPDKSKLIVGGGFQNINDSPAYGMGAIDAINGNLLPWDANTVVRTAGQKAAVISLSTDGTAIYGTSFNFGTGNFEGVFSADPTSGAVNWLGDCHGDTYDSYAVNGTVYTLGHAHQCENIGGFPESRGEYKWYRAMAFTAQATGTVAKNSQPGPGYGNFEGQPAPSIVNWFPDLTAGNFTGQGQAGWTMDGNGDYVVVAGEFPSVNGTAQYGITRFATTDAAPNARGPVLSGPSWPLTAQANSRAVDLLIETNWDQDDLALTYQIMRADKWPSPVATFTESAPFWNPKTLTFRDADVVAGSTYKYYVKATDNDGNVKTSASQEVTVPTGTPSKYAQSVVDDGAAHYWPLDESASTMSSDVVSGLLLKKGSGVAATESGAIQDDGAASFDGTTNGSAGAVTAQTPPSALSIEAWVNTTSTKGGQIVGFGNLASGHSNQVDRHLYLNNKGQVSFGILADTDKRSITSASTLNDGNWHHVVGTVGADGMTLYVDGVAVAADASVTSASVSYDGFWRLGGDQTGGWPNRGESNFLAGSIDDVAVYPKALNAEQVSAHYSAAFDAPSTAPTADFTESINNTAVAFDGTNSTSSDGTIASYSWDFGDGSTATGPQPEHNYAAAGFYDVTLTVTDDDGATGSITKALVVAPGTVVAADRFDRTAAKWNDADVGGTWSVAGGSSRCTVDGSSGLINLEAPGVGPSPILPKVSALDTYLSVKVSVDQVATGGGAYFSTIVRRTAAGDYRLKLRYQADGVLSASLSKVVSGAETTLASIPMPGLTYAGGDAINIRFSAVGSTETTLTATVWKSGSAEPASPTISGTDSTAELQTAGSIGVQGYLSGSATAAPIVISVDDLIVSTT